MGLAVKQETHVEDVDTGHSLLHRMGDNFGYGALILLIVAAGLIVFRRKIIKFLGIK